MGLRNECSICCWQSNDGSEAVNVDYLNDKIKDSADALTNNKGLKFNANVGGEQTINLVLLSLFKVKVKLMMLTTAVKILKLSSTKTIKVTRYRREDE